MNILVTTDKNYLPHAYTMLVSLMENNPNSHIDLYYVHYDIDDASIDRFKEFFSQYNMTVTFLKYDFTKIEGLKTAFHLTQATYLRIICPDILPKIINKILYLDPDIIVGKSLTDLYNTDLGDCFIGAVKVDDPENERHIALNIPNKYRYFSAGVMLVNLEKFRSNNVSKRVMDYAIRHRDRTVWCDQCALNAVLYDKCLAIHYRWNVPGRMLTMNNDKSNRLSDEIVEALSDPGIIHYDGTGKPWQPFCNHARKELYWHYVKKTPFRYTEPLRYCCRYILWKPKSIAGFLMRKLILRLPAFAQRIVPDALKHRLRIAVP